MFTKGIDKGNKQQSNSFVASHPALSNSLVAAASPYKSGVNGKRGSKASNTQQLKLNLTTGSKCKDFQSLQLAGATSVRSSNSKIVAKENTFKQSNSLSKPITPVPILTSPTTPLPPTTKGTPRK